MVTTATLLLTVIRKGPAVLQLLTSEDQSLLVTIIAKPNRKSVRARLLVYRKSRYSRGNSLLVLDLGLDIVDGVRRLNLEGDGFTRKARERDIR
jgi:hypothetical protein